LFQPFGAAGLAAATAAGAWVNFGLLVFLARRQGAMRFDALLGKVVLASALASIALACVAIFGRAPAEALAQSFDGVAAVVQLALLGGAGAAVYGVALFGLLRAFGVRAAKLRPAKIPVAKIPPPV
jgi:putative peptidoglycan lipid II flippase